MQKTSQSLLLAQRQLGQGMAEYIIIVALVAVAGIAVWSSVGSAIQHQAAAVATEIAGGDGASEVAAAQASAATAGAESAEQQLDDYTGQNN